MLHAPASARHGIPRPCQWPRTTVSLLLLLSGTFAVLPACGRKTPVRPPEDVVPAAIDDLRAQSSPQGVELTWSRPRRLADGTALFSLQGFRIERSRSNGLFEHLSAVLVEDRDRFRQVRRFRYLDRTATPGEVFAYRVSSFTVDGELSAPSNTVEIVAAVPEAEGTPTPESAP